MDMAVPVDIPQVHNNMLITVVQLGKIVLLLITIIIALIILNILCRILTVITSIDTSRKAGLCGEEEEQHKDKGYEETYLENTFRKVVDFLTIPY
ncbi:hypothetical protein NEPAR06_1876 [Nematocida parisii]|uniref:Uncharacterized protein n=1 Tax=Nematocida parisii (strain ERTm3) TaxID=935791 RepID=I3EJL5_NEMP3|nr:uncharacterized protein NEPG_01062 [Nematocida parisii ERTm1]EIJ89412.1 hypothetical protein NEQG_00182 [Nematocida parisii ERTm3]KAI5129834.1 hypothetical protein NEPAR03_1839 [Nematocida parisii]EIJ94394.1 hypothetical protein NEPG_01062 [Nematocida parisii ERTm1]KAI5131133.1 hypothetical protein NEPAR08_2341 [Nematocida parisii]KAI5145183.1 hypothetical protein NEPAR07_1509 [Nematocida parisii]|eukprot:XP_013058890.1 hypothetical protein NEPG_01062 [Nematocida parisii ERTm1]